MPRRYLYMAALAASAALASCQGAAGDSDEQADHLPTYVGSNELARERDMKRASSMVATFGDSKKKIADIQRGRPCRVQIDGTDFIVGVEPFVMMVGETKYEGSATGDSTVFTRDGAAVARYMESGNGSSNGSSNGSNNGSNNELTLFKPDGTALLRVNATEGVVRNGGGSPVREIRREGETFVVSSSAGDIYVTGPADVLLAAVVTATEASPEVRALAACHRMQKVRP